MQHPSLKDFIAHARSKGMDHQTIRMLLLSSGWKEKDVVEGLTEATLDMPVPAPEDRGGAREAFFHLLAFVTLYASVVSVLVLLFEYLNRLFPDAAFDYSYYNDDSSFIRWFIATLLVSFPVFAWMSTIINKDLAKNPERAWSPVRRWLTYLTLFVTAGVLVGDGITLLFYLLEGEISVRFILKVFAVLAVAGMVFSYYFLALKTSPKDPRAASMNRSFGIAATVVALGVIVWGMFFAGTPLAQRVRRLDDVRVQNLRTIQQEIYNIAYEGTDRYNQGKPFTALPNPLPTTLDQVVTEATYQRPVIVDPETGTQYGYEVDGTDFRLCATFGDVEDQDYDVFWNHPAGEHCYEFDGLDPNGK
jgi:heme/copper-type cytochrome/quinol oxidase subunit 4